MMVSRRRGRSREGVDNSKAGWVDSDDVKPVAKVEDLDDDDSTNPFAYDAPVTAYELGKMVFLTLTGVVFVRVVLFLVAVLMAFLCALIATAGLDKQLGVYEKPLSRWRRICLAPVSPLCRFALFVFGFYRIKVNGRKSEQACIITPNHVSMFDLLIMYWLLLPSALSKAETFKLPIISTVFRALQVIPVQRENEQDKKKAVDTIKRFADSVEKESDPTKRFPPILIFPQGTTTKETALTMFQRGAFIPGKPVQPVALSYPWKHFNPAFVVNRKKDYFIFRHLTQFYYSCEVTFLPLHRPTPEELQDPTVFANNVRASIAQVLKARTTDHCYEDAKLYRCALSLEAKRFKDTLFDPIPDEKKIKLKGLELRKIKDMFEVSKKAFSLHDAQAIMQNFVKVDTNEDGKISLEEFAAALGYDASSSKTKQLFSFFDRDGSGEIDFKELVVGMAICNPYSTSEERAKLAFQLYDQNGDGFVSEEELRSLLRYSGEGVGSKHRRATEYQLQRLLNKLEKPIKISWDQFKEYVPPDSALVSTALLSVDGNNNDEKRPKFFPTLVRQPSSQIEEDE